MAHTPEQVTFKATSGDPSEHDPSTWLALRKRWEELRGPTVRTVLLFGVAYLVGLLLARPLLDHIVHSSGFDRFDIGTPIDAVPLYLKTALYIALGGAMPVLVSQFADLLAPGMTTREKRLVIASLPVMALFYASGALLAVSYVAPRVLAFLLDYAMSRGIY